MRSLAVAFGLFLVAFPIRADRPEAERLIGEAYAAIKAGRESEGRDLADRAVRADPGWGETYAARGIAHLWLKQSRAAAADLTYAVARGAGGANIRGYLAQALCDVKRWHEALEAAEAAVRGLPNWEVGYHTRARARLELGMVDEAIADWTQALRAKEVGYLYMRARGLLAAGEFASCIEDCDRWATFDDPSDRRFALFTRCVARVLIGKYAEAQADAATMMKDTGSFGGPVGTAYLHALARDPKWFDPAKALEAIARLPADLRTVRTVNAQALVLAAAENYPAALEELAFHQDRPDYEAAALRALCLWRMGDGAAARTALAQALRLNPYLPRHLEKNRVLAPLAGLLPRAETAVKAEAGSGAPRELDLEREGFPFLAAMIEALAHQYRFDEAAREYEAWVPSLASPVHREAVQERSRALKGLAAAMDRLIAAINGKTYADIEVKAGDVTTSVTAASPRGFDYRFAQGEGKGLWIAFGPAELADLLLRGKPDPATLLAVGQFGFERGLDKYGAPLLNRALETDPGLRPDLDRWLSARRGCEPPPEGFVFHQNAFVTPEEKVHLDQGEVLFRGDWIPRKDRDQIAAGKVKVGGKWVPVDEKKLTALGYRKRQAKWLTPEEYRAVTRPWANAAEEKTRHFAIRTNLGPDFAIELGRVAEAAYADLAAVLGGKEPGGARMSLLAFHGFDDYRSWCRENRLEDRVALRGFVRTADPPLAATYDLANDTGETLRSLVHEATRLYALRAFPEAKFPAWLLEGLCGLAEGFSWNGREYEFPHVSPPQLALVQRAALAGLTFPLTRLTTWSREEALASGPRDSAIWTAQCWALAYFLEKSPHPAHAGLLRRFIDAAGAGQPVDLAAALGAEASAFEREFIEFVKGL